MRKQPFADLVGLGLPWAQGVFAQHRRACYAVKAPTDALAVLRTTRCCPRRFKPRVPGRPTARCSATRSTRRRRRRSSRSSTCAPARWRRAATRATGPTARSRRSTASPTFWAGSAGQRRRVVLPAAAVARRRRGERAAAQRGRRGRLKLRAVAPRDVDVPLYAFQTDLTKGRVLRGARRFIERSRRAALGARCSSTAARRRATSTRSPPRPTTNDFLKTVVPFLKRTMKRGASRWPPEVRMSPPQYNVESQRSSRQHADRRRRAARAR